MDEAEQKQVERRLPPAAQVYLSVWSMGVGPDGKALRVSSAARLAGVSVSAVKGWRDRIDGFRELEAQARAANSNYTRRLARRIVEGLVAPAGTVLAQALEEGNVSLAWNIVKAAGGMEPVMRGSGDRLAGLLAELRELDDDGQVADVETETAAV